LELNAFVGQLAKRRQTEHLKAAAVGEQRSLPSDKVMQAAKPIDDQVAGPQIKMISVSEDDSGSGCFEHLLGKRFDRALRAYGHEGWSVE
jgi:hypothetical protein